MSKLKVGINIQIINKERLAVGTEDIQVLINDLTKFMEEHHFCISSQTQKNLTTSTTFMYFAFDGHNSREWKVEAEK